MLEFGLMTIFVNFGLVGQLLKICENFKKYITFGQFILKNITVKEYLWFIPLYTNEFDSFFFLDEENEDKWGQYSNLMMKKVA